jgi:hypothetical protein
VLVRFLISILTTLSFLLPMELAAASPSKKVTNFSEIYQSFIYSSTNAKISGTQKYSWSALVQYGESFLQLAGKSVFDKNSSRNYDVVEIESVWVDELLNLSCFTSANSPVGKTASFRRVNFIDPFPVIKSEYLNYKNNELNRADISINFSVHQKCAEIRVNTNSGLFLQAQVKDAKGLISSRYIWLDNKNTKYEKLESISGVKKPADANPTVKPSTKTPSKSTPSPKKASCSIFQGKEIYATYGMAEPPFGVTTIKFENITDCILDVTIRGDFIGISNNQQMRCNVVGNWSLDPYSKTEFAPAGTVNGGVSFQTVFPQLSKCFRTINAQKNFIAVITAGRE